MVGPFPELARFRRRRREPPSALVVGLVVLSCLSLVAAACTGTKKPKPVPITRRGGAIVLGSDQWPPCLNPVTQCALSPSTFWLADQYVLPKLLYLDPNGKLQPSALITEAPTEANGGIKAAPFTLTFHLNPRAVWDDNSPITSADVAFTWQAYLKAKVVASGYDQIDSVDASDPHTAVIRFKGPFADWPDLFGGSQGHVLKKAAFPDGPDVASEMQTSLPFSGMPWKLQTFSKDQAVLVPNTNYWVPADIPMLDKVTFVAGTGQDTEINSLMAGDLAGIYPQASPGLAARLSAANVKYRIGGGASFEGIWPNLSKPPLDDPKVRQALFMSIDRNEILNTFIKPDVPDATVLNCGGWVPTLGEWCDNAQFADIKYDPAGAKTILQGDGWALGPDGVFAKGGQRLDLELNTVAGNSRREGLEQVIMRQAAKAGFAFHPKNYSRPELTEDVLPHGRFGIAIYSQAARSDPSVTSLFSCDQIPSVANQFTGTNYSHWCDAAVSGLMKRSDQEVSPVRHVVLIHQVGRAIRDGYVWLPFYQLPVIAAYRTDKVAGPVEDFTLSSYTNFWNINKWHLP